ncbi:hypothetical protein AQUCO_04400032v1 [Aquilegia coerulea]|uniref:Ubiquinol-cytochrome c chaperone domain-containing protein n=2 Tax=Aquilegia coerulea TaxID=218851 RepID=A0A2G5CNY7_AQUCA|nr:hypothetical protein AQUCO_04400032v1 [Aquilegia coerulea]
MVPRWGRAFMYLSKLGADNCTGKQRHLPFAHRNYVTVAAAVDTSTLDPPNKVFSGNPQVNLNKMFWSKPCSLALPPDSPLVVEDPKYEGIKHIIFKLLMFYSEQSKSIRGANVIYGRVISQVEKPAIYDVFNLEKTFKTTFSLLVLHMWLCLRRLKAEGKDGVELGQYLYEIYNHDVELRVSKAGVNLLLIKWMKEVERIFYGNIVAYDAAMLPEAKPDELQNVIWRNIFSEDGSPVPNDSASRILQAMTRYARREAACMSLTDKEALFSGNFMFTSLGNPPGIPASEK